MRRRALLKSLLAAAVTAPGFRLPLVNAPDYRGKLFVFVQADGGWDPTSFCDPKANTLGAPIINHWVQRDDIRQAGNIPYAPFANNMAFFEKYRSRMLVINGVDAQTNSRTVGIVRNWSGRTAEGYPTLSALLAAHYAPALPISYLSFGGFFVTAGITRFTRINEARLLKTIARPAVQVWNPSQRIIGEADWASLEAPGQRLRSAARQRLICCGTRGAIWRSTSRRSRPTGWRRTLTRFPPTTNWNSGKECLATLAVPSAAACADRRS